MWPNLQFSADLVIFTEESFQKNFFFCSALIVTISYETFFQSLYSKRCMKNITQGSLGS